MAFPKFCDSRKIFIVILYYIKIEPLYSEKTYNLMYLPPIILIRNIKNQPVLNVS